MKMKFQIAIGVVVAFILVLSVHGMWSASQRNAIRAEAGAAVFNGLRIAEADQDKFVVTASEQVRQGKPVMEVCLNPLASKLQDRQDLLKLKGCNPQPLTSQIYSDKMYAAEKGGQNLAAILAKQRDDKENAKQ